MVGDCDYAGKQKGQGRTAAASPPAAERNSLEQYKNTVTDRVEEIGAWFEVGKCRCDCWFCPDCCRTKGYALRAELVPILQAFGDLRLVTFTVDPTLFSSPREAFLHMLDKRCVSKTVQDLRRGGYLHSGQWFCVVEWQKKTEQAHFHVLLDAPFIPHGDLLASWSKHRPKLAGPVEGKRPPFGTVFITKPTFEGGAVHAARYLTKYLTKMPEAGFPEWVLEMGAERRIRRYSTSRGFWGRPSEERVEAEGHREVVPLTYGERVAACGKTVNLFRVASFLNLETGEVTESARWIGELGIDSEVLASLPDVAVAAGRRLLAVETVTDAVRAIEAVAGVSVPGVRWSAGGF